MKKASFDLPQVHINMNVQKHDRGDMLDMHDEEKESHLPHFELTIFLSCKSSLSSKSGDLRL